VLANPVNLDRSHIRKKPDPKQACDNKGCGPDRRLATSPIISNSANKKFWLIQLKSSATGNFIGKLTDTVLLIIGKEPIKRLKLVGSGSGLKFRGPK
jgi:hypothetical protein